jgi:hypothetical protein
VPTATREKPVWSGCSQPLHFRIGKKFAITGITANMAKLGIRPGANLMTEYRAYAIGGDGHIFKSAPLVCDDDDQAIARAKLAFGNCTIEVWSGVRFVVRLDALAGGRPVDGSANRLQDLAGR